MVLFCSSHITLSWMHVWKLIFCFIFLCLAWSDVIFFSKAQIKLHIEASNMASSLKLSQQMQSPKFSQFTSCVNSMLLNTKLLMCQISAIVLRLTKNKHIDKIQVVNIHVAREVSTLTSLKRKNRNIHVSICTSSIMKQITYLRHALNCIPESVLTVKGSICISINSHHSLPKAWFFFSLFRGCLMSNC